MTTPTLLIKGSLKLGSALVSNDEVPITYITGWVKKRMSEYGTVESSMKNRVLIIKAETGSGKSTVLPVAMFRILRGEKTPITKKYRGQNVICTQPRVMTAIALVNDVSSKPWNPDIKMGLTVGYQTGPISNKPPAGLLYATSGVLSVQLQTNTDDEIMDLYRFIMVDEAHERSIDGDMILMLLKNFYLRNLGNKKLPFLLLTSATYDTKIYSKYFGVPDANIINVIGRTYKITTHWPEYGFNDYITGAVSTVIKIHKDNLSDPPNKADILIFTPGIHEINSINFLLQQELEKIGANIPFLIILVNRDIVIAQSEDYELIFKKPDLLPKINGVKPIRRIIISTIVAETGLTIDTLKYVIDCGWNRSLETYQPFGAIGLITRPAQKNRIIQRKGRAGRLFEGEFYPLYTEKSYEELDDQQLPDIITSGIAPIYLALIQEQQKQKLLTGLDGKFRVEDIDLLDAPSPESIMSANYISTTLGFTDINGLTEIGKIAAKFSHTSMEAIKILFSAFLWDVSMSDLITAVIVFGKTKNDFFVKTKGDMPLGADVLRAALPSFLVSRIGGGGPILVPPSEDELFYYRCKMLIADDFIELILIFELFMAKLNEKKDNVISWCKKMNIKFDKLLELLKLRESIIEDLLIVGINPCYGDDKKLSYTPIEIFTYRVCLIKKCFYEGLRHNLLEYQPDNPLGAGYYTLHNMKVKSPDFFLDSMSIKLKALKITEIKYKPKWIITDRFVIVPNKMTKKDAKPPLLYSLETNFVSVIDGFYNPDFDFYKPQIANSEFAK